MSSSSIESESVISHNTLYLNSIKCDSRAVTFYFIRSIVVISGLPAGYHRHLSFTLHSYGSNSSRKQLIQIFVEYIIRCVIIDICIHKSFHKSKLLKPCEQKMHATIPTVRLKLTIRLLWQVHGICEQQQIDLDWISLVSVDLRGRTTFSDPWAAQGIPNRLDWSELTSGWWITASAMCSTLSLGSWEVPGGPD